MASPYESVDELFSGRTGTPFDANGGQRNYVRRFLVVVRDQRLSSLAVCNCPGLPLPFSFYQSGNGVEYDLLAVCTKLSAVQQTEDDWQNWIVTAEYSTRIPKGGIPTNTSSPDKGSGSQNNPELEPPDVEWEFDTVQKPLQRDLDGKPFTTSACRPFSPPPTFEMGHAVLVFSRNELSFDRVTAAGYAYSVNSDRFLGAAPDTVMCIPPRAKLVFRGTLQYWRVSYRFKFLDFPLADGSQETWQPSLLDADTYRLETHAISVDFNKPVPIFRRGHPVTHPVLLDGKGQELPDLVPFLKGSISPPAQYRKFRVYKSKAFMDLFKKGMGAAR